jgi:hypothetical protein
MEKGESARSCEVSPPRPDEEVASRTRRGGVDTVPEPALGGLYQVLIGGVTLDIGGDERADRHDAEAV